MAMITSREAIARHAAEAAAAWVRNPSAPAPTNPHDPLIEPEHHGDWKAAFERYLVLESAPEAETSA